MGKIIGKKSRKKSGKNENAGKESGKKTECQKNFKGKLKVSFNGI